MGPQLGLELSSQLLCCNLHPRLLSPAPTAQPLPYSALDVSSDSGFSSLSCSLNLPCHSVPPKAEGRKSVSLASHPLHSACLCHLSRKHTCGTPWGECCSVHFLRGLPRTMGKSQRGEYFHSFTNTELFTPPATSQ